LAKPPEFVKKSSASAVKRGWFGITGIDEDTVIMKHFSKKSVLIALALGLASLSSEALTFQHELFKPTVNLDSGTQNTWTGTMGGAFATWQGGAVVSHLGYYDSLGDGLANSHTVNLFVSNGGLLASVVVPSGTAAPLADGYRWVALNTPLSLPENTWYTLSADVDGVDLFGDLLFSGSTATMDDPYYNTGAWGGPYARFGDDPVSNEPLGGSYGYSIYPAANLGLEAVPEPSFLALGSLGLLAFLARRGLRR
jgi:hypothetical protein